MTLALPKAALRADGARPLVGRLYVADIAIPPAVLERVAIRCRSPFSRGPVIRIVARLRSCRLIPSELGLAAEPQGGYEFAESWDG